MDGYELLLILPPVIALLGAWAGYRSVKKSAAEIDRIRDELHVRKEQAMMRESPPVRSSAPMQTSAPMQASASEHFDHVLYGTADHPRR